MRTPILTVAALAAALFSCTLRLSAQWRKTSAPIENDVSAITVIDSTTLVVGTSSGTVLNPGILISTDRGETWRGVDSADAVWSLASFGDTIYAGTTRSGVYRSTDRGVTWSMASAGLESAELIVLARSAGNLYAGAFPPIGSSTNLYRSSNLGDAWSPLPFVTTSRLSVLALGATDDYLLAATAQDGLLRSIDGGYSWQEVEGASGGLGAQAIAFGAGAVWFAGSGGLYRHVDTTETLDSVMSWTRVDGIGTPYSVAVDRGTIVVGADDSVYVSIDSGATWKAYTEGFLEGHRDVIWSVAITDEDIYAGGRFLWRMARPKPAPAGVTMMTAEEPGIRVVAGASGEIIVRGAEDADIRVYSLLGREVAHRRGGPSDMSIGGLRSGVYVVAVRRAGAMWTAKVAVRTE